MPDNALTQLKGFPVAYILMLIQFWSFKLTLNYLKGGLQQDIGQKADFYFQRVYGTSVSIGFELYQNYSR